MSDFITSAPRTDFNSDEPDGRKWVHHSTTGDRGFLVEEDGKTLVQLDRVNQVIRRPYNTGEWVLEEDHRPLTIHSLAQVSYAADGALMVAMGRAQNPAPWVALRENDKLRWIKQGPGGKGPRAKLYAAINKALGNLLEVD